MKQIVKTFNNLIKKTIFNVWNKTNINFKINHLNIVKRFNKSIEKTIFKIQNIKALKLRVSKFNKYFISFISLLFLYLFYLLIPILYDKNWVQKNIENQLFDNFKIHFSLSSDISYRILPSPHYLVKDSKILKTEDKIISLADIKTLKVFVSQKNFFNKDKVPLKYIKIKDADFILQRRDLKLLKNSTNNKFSNKKIEITKSSIFLKNNLNEIVSIIKISEAFLYQDEEDLLNLFKLRGKIFNIPFSLDYNKNINFLKEEEINILVKKLKLKIFNTSSLDKNNIINGKNIISFLNSKINTNYKADKDIITFNSTNSKLKNSKVNYNGQVSINPFDLRLNINLDNFDLRKLFNPNSILNELIRTNLLFNENVSMSTSITTSSNLKNKIFQNIKINFNAKDGKLNIDKTRLINKKIGLLELMNSNLSFESERLILNTDIIIDIKNHAELFSLLQTNKKFRKPIKNILINLDYDFLSKRINFNNVKIDNNAINDELLRIIEGFNDNELNNWNKSKRLLNIFFEVYEG